MCDAHIKPAVIPNVALDFMPKNGQGRGAKCEYDVVTR